MLRGRGAPGATSLDSVLMVHASPRPLERGRAPAPTKARSELPEEGRLHPLIQLAFLLLRLDVLLDRGDHLLGRRVGGGFLVEDRVERVARGRPYLAHRRDVREGDACLRLLSEA